MAIAETPASTLESAFEDNLREFVAKYTALWWDTPAECPSFGETFTPQRQQANERHADLLIDDLERALQSYPGTEPERESWREHNKNRIRLFSQECLGYSDSHIAILFSRPYFDVTAAFIRQAKSFDETVEVEDLFQALRNVWIMNSIQMFLGMDIAFSDPIFAYSMLYPVTDNYLDDPGVSRESKSEMNIRLERRLAGTDLSPCGTHEQDTFRLIAQIEGTYPRYEFPEVYFSLLAIHRAQIQSLRQQGRRQPPYETDILGISVEKGGTSVLAHGYLVNGNLRKDEADFMFGYGVFLQFLDDLQDARSDSSENHMTIFSQSAGTWPLDRLTNRLRRYMARVLESTAYFSDPRTGILTELIEKNCVFLILQAVAQNHEFFSADYVRKLEACSPFRFSYLRKRRGTVGKKYTKIKKTLQREKNLHSVFDVLG